MAFPIDKYKFAYRTDKDGIKYVIAISTYAGKTVKGIAVCSPEDEYDEDEENLIQKISEHEYLIEGSMKLDDVNDALGLSFESEDYDSIGGLIIELLDRLPEQHEAVTTEDGIRLKVENIDKNRIDTVRLTIPDKEEVETA